MMPPPLRLVINRNRAQSQRRLPVVQLRVSSCLRAHHSERSMEFGSCWSTCGRRRRYIFLPGWSKRLRLLCWEDESYYKLGERPRQCLSDLPVCRAQLAKPTALRGRTKSGTIKQVQKINMWMVFGGAGILAFWCTPDTGVGRFCPCKTEM